MSLEVEAAVDRAIACGHALVAKEAAEAKAFSCRVETWLVNALNAAFAADERSGASPVLADDEECTQPPIVAPNYVTSLHRTQPFASGPEEFIAFEREILRLLILDNRGVRMYVHSLAGGQPLTLDGAAAYDKDRTHAQVYNWRVAAWDPKAIWSVMFIVEL